MRDSRGQRGSPAQGRVINSHSLVIEEPVTPRASLTATPEPSVTRWGQSFPSQIPSSVVRQAASGALSEDRSFLWLSSLVATAASALDPQGTELASFFWLKKKAAAAIALKPLLESCLEGALGTAFQTV